MFRLILLFLFVLFSIESFAEKPATFSFEPCEVASSNGTGITTATTTEILAGVANKRHSIIKLELQNIGSTTTLVQVQIEDGDIIWEKNLAENQPDNFGVTNKYYELPVGKGLELVTNAAGDIRYSLCYN